MVAQILGRAETERARAFVEAQGLAFETGFDELVGVYERDALVAAGARAGDLLKMIALAPEQRGGALLGTLVTELVALGYAAGHAALFVVTRPEHVTSFERLNFALLASHGRAALLESGHGLAGYLAAHRPLVRPGTNGAVVVNCNPFTLGHRHLVEQAARAADTLYVFVVREDRSQFPFPVRMALVREGTKDLSNVRVLDTSRYAVSAITFPAYFLKATDDVAEIQMELDAVLFAEGIAPSFGVRRRFFGTEPACATTRAYNAVLKRVLPRFGVEACEIPRLETGGAAISASRVRDALRRGDLAGASALVPEVTKAFLASKDGAEVRRRLLGGGGSHG
jgi:[citrate (pro-3S)-lyase] ligase